VFVTTAGFPETYVHELWSRYPVGMSPDEAFRSPDVWAHFDRYFATAEVHGVDREALSFVCISRWSPRHDWQIIRLDLRTLDAAKYKRIKEQPVKMQRGPKASLPRIRKVPVTWFPPESELDRFLPLATKTLATFGSEIRAVATRHVLAYGMVEESADPTHDHVVALTARRYRQLANIGETSPAAVLARATDTPVRTIQNRIRIARERGLLPPAGSGRRRLEPLDPTASEMQLVTHLIDHDPKYRSKQRTSSAQRKTLRPRGRAPLAHVR